MKNAGPFSSIQQALSVSSAHTSHTQLLADATQDHAVPLPRRNQSQINPLFALGEPPQSLSSKITVCKVHTSDWAEGRGQSGPRSRA
eukprot:3941486-Rhodomonas_salina.1